MAIIALSVAGVLSSTFVVAHVGAGARRSTEEVRREIDAIVVVRSSLEAEANAAHALVDFGRQVAPQFILAHDRTAAALAQAPTAFDGDERHVVTAIRAEWVRTFGPYRSMADDPTHLSEMAADRASAVRLHGTLAGAMEAVRVAIDRAERAPLREAGRNVDANRRSARLMLSVLYALLLAAVAVIFSLMRRLRGDVLAPMARLRDAAGRVASGEIDQRAPAERDEEFCDLRVAVNRMADTLVANQRVLAAQANRLRSVIDTAGTAFVAMDADGRITDWNHRAEELFGWSRDEICGREVADTIVPPPLRESHRAGLRRFLATGESTILGRTVEIIAVSASGREFPVELSVWHLDDDGVHSFSAFVQDITERKRVSALQARMAAIVEASEAAIIGITPDLVVTSWNPAAEKLFGFASYQALGRSLQVLLPGTLTPLLQRVAAGERVSAEEAQVSPLRDITMTISVSAAPIVESGTVTGISCIAHDITEQRKLEEVLRRSEQRFRSLVQRSSDLTLVADSDGVLVYVSPASRGVLGIDDDWLTGRPISELVHPDDRGLIADSIRRASPPSCGPSAGSEANTIACRVRHDDGSYRRVEITLTDLRDDPGVRGVVVNLRDVTDRHRLEAELRHAQKLESVGQLAAGIAHEINTPIQFVGDNVMFLREAFDNLAHVLDVFHEADAADDPRPALDRARRIEADSETSFILEEAPQAIDQTLEGVARVATIVRAMKAFGHPSSEEKQPADLNEAVRNTLIVANNQVKYVADVVTELGELPPVWCHLGDINQVLLNLVVNAAHAVGAANGDGGRGTITVRTRQDGREVVIDVEDTGIGIPTEIADRVFEPFFTTKDVGVGTGQGLALAYSLICERHGGTIGFTSQPGSGTTFTVRLPVDASKTGTDAASPSSQPSPSSQSSSSSPSSPSSLSSSVVPSATPRSPAAPVLSPSPAIKDSVA